jgi:hypothetical protein
MLDEFPKTSISRQLTIVCGSTFLEIQDHDITVNNLDILGDMDSCQGVVTRNHNALTGQGNVNFG